MADLLTEEIKTKLKLSRVRGDTFGYLQRSFAGCVSDVDSREARLAGERAVQLGIGEDKDGSIAIKRVGEYKAELVPVALNAVAGKTKIMPDEFIAASGTDVTDAFRRYLKPLLGSDVPAPAKLVAPKIAKIIKK